MILPKLLTCSFYCCHPQVSLDWTTTLMRACVTHLTLKFYVPIMTVLLHTAMQISSICLGTTLRIELNGLKMDQLFGISRLILESINDAIHQWCDMANYRWDLRFMFWFRVCRVYLLVLWYGWWARIYNIPHDTAIPTKTYRWILCISYQQH